MHTLCSRWSANIVKRYGRKQGWLWHHLFLLAQLLGSYQRFQRIDWNRVTRLVFVCKGNTCRSPYSEARARAFGLAASSFGLQADDRMPVNPVAVKVGRQRGLDLIKHFSRPTNSCTFLPSDLLIGMEPWQGKQLRSLSHGTGAQITLLGLWHSQPRPHIEDPYGLDEDYFNTCFAIIDDAIQHIAYRMEASHAQ